MSDEQRLRELFRWLGLNPKNPEHSTRVEEYLARFPLGFGFYVSEAPAPMRRRRRPQEWDALAYRRLVQRVERLQHWYPRESELAICGCLAKHCLEYKDRKAKATTLKRRLAEARKRGIT